MASTPDRAQTEQTKQEINQDKHPKVNNQPWHYWSVEVQGVLAGGENEIGHPPGLCTLWQSALFYGHISAILPVWKQQNKYCL